MTYLRTNCTFGLGHGYIGGLGNLGDDFVIDWSHADSAVLAFQQILQRLGFLIPGTGVDAADGKWGPRTEHALVMAAQYVGWTGAPFAANYENSSHSRGSVTIAPGLLELLRTSPPAPAGTAGRIGVSEPAQPAREPAIVIGPETGYGPEPVHQGLPWWPWVLIGGGVLMMGGAGIWIMRQPKRAASRASVTTRRSQMVTVHANRRSRRRRSRR